MGRQYLLVGILAVLISVSVLVINTKSVYADPSGSDTASLPAIQNYVDTSIRISDCTTIGSVDSDGDGICDSWENPTTGLHVSFSSGGVTYTYDLPCDPAATYTTDPTGYKVCPSTSVKDVYVEVDWMNGHGPSTTAINDVVSAFNNAPVPVHLHIQYGETPGASSGGTGVHWTTMKVGNLALWNTDKGFWVLKENKFGSIGERDSSNSTHNYFCIHSDGTSESWHDCGTAKRNVFHYALFAHSQYGNTGSSGWAEIFGNDYVISLGSFTSDVWDTDKQEAAFMHELGHNLGLYHGGGVPPDVNGNGMYDATDDAADNCKPNYLSIMSYTYEFRHTGSGKDQCRPLDYSRIANTNYDENNLNEANIGSYPYPNPDPNPPGSTGVTCNDANHNGQERPIWYSGPTGSIIQSNTGAGQNWNQAPGTANQNINNLGTTGCSDTHLSLLQGHNDWGSGGMNYAFLTSALSASGNMTDEAVSSTCDGLSKEPIGYIVPPTLQTSGNASSLKNDLADIGAIAIVKSGLLPSSGSTTGIDKIVVPGVVPIENLSKATKNMGATFFAGSLKPAGEDFAIPVHTLSNSQGNIEEWSCDSVEETSAPGYEQPVVVKGDKGDTGPPGDPTFSIIALIIAIIAIIIAGIAIVLRRR